MSNILDKAKEYLEINLSVLPTKEDKTPAINSWENLQHKILSKTEIDTLFIRGVIRPEIEREITRDDKTKYIRKGIKCFKTPLGIGIITGAISGNLEVIDVDTKYDETGYLWEDLRTLLEDNLPDLYSSLVIAKTKNKGYHIYYRCSSIAGSLKLAYKLNREILIETRGEGGYVIAPPTPGYEYIQGGPINIPTITPEDREIILSISRSFNLLEEEKPKAATPSATTYNSTGLSPFEDYNQRGDVVGLLQNHGWKTVSQRGERINLLRPGSTDSKTSGNYHTELKVLRVFSSSTEFNPNKGYSPAMVFSLLECSGDNKLTYRKLLELGYGEPYNGEVLKPTQVKTKVTTINLVSQVNTITYKPGEAVDFLEINNAKEVVLTPKDKTEEAITDILKTIADLRQTEKRVYVKEDQEEVRDYNYIINHLFKKYNDIQQLNGTLTDRNKDDLVDEIVVNATFLNPIDKDIYLKIFLTNVAELGINQQSIEIAVEKLSTSKDKQAQAQELKELLAKALELQNKGETAKILKLIDSGVKEVKLRDKITEFKALSIATTEEELKQRLKDKPNSLSTGYKIARQELLLPAKAISVISAATSHGKTTFLLNLAINVAINNPEKQFYVFSLEEDQDSVLIKALNIYLNKDLSGNNITTLSNYFKGENKTQIDTNFFKELIDTNRLNINYTSYDADTLIEAIRYLHKTKNVGGIFIDYLQLLNVAPGKYKTYSRQEEMKQICQSLKDLAVETGLPIILGAQFNRTVKNHLQIHATNIGEAGDIERIANLIIGFWNNNFKPIATEAELNEISKKGFLDKDTFYVTILKNRGGVVGTEGKLSFNGNTGKISNYSLNSI